MSQFTLYKNEDSSSNEIYPYFIDVQNSLLEDLNSRLVIPHPHATLNNTNAKRLCPVIHLDEGNFVGSLWIPDWYSGLSLGLGRQRSQDSVGS